MRLTKRFDAALGYAGEAHGDQARKGSDVPYVSHLLAVCSLVLEYGGDEDEAIGALLHDVVEDQGGVPRLEEIRERFGNRVAEIVEGCSDAFETPKPPWQARKEAYLAHLSTACFSVLLVSAADKLHNARSIVRDFRLEGDSIWTRFKAGKEGTLWYYAALVDAYAKVNLASVDQERKRAFLALVGELDRTVRQLQVLTASAGVANV